MKQIQLILLFTSLILITCKTDKKQDVKEIDTSKQFPVVLDTFGIDKFDNFNYRMKLQESTPEDIIPGAVCSLIKYNKPILDIQ